MGKPKRVNASGVWKEVMSTMRAFASSSLIPLQRPGTPLEIAQAIAWLISDEAAYVTGAVLDVSGGR